MIELVHQYARDHGFSGDPNWDRPVGSIKRGWDSDFWKWPKGILNSTIPDISSEQVPLDVKLSLEFVGEIDFRGTEGRKIRLQKYGDSRIIWSSDPDQSNSGQGETTIVFNDFPVLEPGEHYYITWDEGWANYMDQGRLKPIRACLESAFAFRFKTVPE